MPDQDKPFTPQLVDEQIEQFLPQPEQQRQAIAPEAELVMDIHELYRASAGTRDRCTPPVARADGEQKQGSASGNWHRSISPARAAGCALSVDVGGIDTIPSGIKVGIQHSVRPVFIECPSKDVAPEAER